MKKLKVLLSVGIITALMLTGCSAKEEAAVASETSVETEVVSEEVASEEVLADADDSTEEEKPSSGYMTENTFTNEYLGFSVELPATWEVQGDESLEKMNEIGSEMASNGDAETKENIQKAINETLLFQVGAFKYPIESQKSPNPNVVLIAENMNATGTIYTTEEYINLLKSGFSVIDAVTDITIGDDATIDGTLFKTLIITMDINGTKSTLTYYTTTIKEYALSLAFASYNDELVAEFDEIRNSIKFN